MHDGASHHHHDHDHAAASGDRTYTLLHYTYDHNAHHMDELDGLIAALDAAGKKHAADCVRAAKEAFAAGTESLHEALHHYWEE